jgi:hypothetical protein
MEQMNQREQREFLNPNTTTRSSITKSSRQTEPPSMTNPWQHAVLGHEFKSGPVTVNRDLDSGNLNDPHSDRWTPNPNFYEFPSHIRSTHKVALFDSENPKGVLLRHEPKDDEGANLIEGTNVVVTTRGVTYGEFVQVQNQDGVVGWVKSKYIKELPQKMSQGGSRSRKYKNKISKKRSRSVHKRRRNNRSKTSRNVRRRVR